MLPLCPLGGVAACNGDFGGLKSGDGLAVPNHEFLPLGPPDDADGAEAGFDGFVGAKRDLGTGLGGEQNK